MAAIAARRDAVHDELIGECIDLASHVHGDTLYWDISEGYWRMFLLIASPSGRHVFHHGLAKLGSSLGHIDPKKNGRTMDAYAAGIAWASSAPGREISGFSGGFVERGARRESGAT